MTTPLPSQPGGNWRGAYAPRNLPRPQVFLPSAQPAYPFPFDSDSVHAEESGFAVLADIEGPAGADAGEAIHVLDADSCACTDTELNSWPRDADTSRMADIEMASWPHDADSSSAAEANGPFRFSDTEACAVSDQAPTVDIYTYQPPFRWTGGGYQLHFAGRVIWSGTQPDAAAYRLWQVLTRAREVRHVADADTVTVAEEHGSALVSVTLAIRPAVLVSLQ